MIVTAHIDESGSHKDAAVLLMGGYVASVARWKDIDQRWAKMLRKFGLTHYHTVDYWARDALGRRVGQYRNWPDELDAKFLTRIQGIVSRYPLFGFTTELARADYLKFYVGDELLRKPRLDHEYGLCFRTALSFLAQYTTPFAVDDVRINVVLENSQYFGEAKRVFDEIKEKAPPDIAGRFGSLVAGRKQDFYGLQAADALISSAARHREQLRFTPLPPDVAPQDAIAEATKWREVPIFRAGANEEVLTELKSGLLALKAIKHQAYLSRKEAAQRAQSTTSQSQ